MSKDKPGAEPLTKEEAAVVAEEAAAQKTFTAKPAAPGLPAKATAPTSGPTATQVAQEHHARHDVVVGPKGEHESQADYDRRVLRGGPAVHPVISAEMQPTATPVVLHLMDADECAVLDRVQVKVRPLIFELDGIRYQQVREQADGSWIYHQLLK